MGKNNIIGITEDQLKQFCKDRDFKDFHGTQIFQWIYHRYAESFSDMTDIPTALRRDLEALFSIEYLKHYSRTVSRHGDTIKYGFVLKDGRKIESVALVDKNGRTSFCLSSQIGCSVGCVYCATGRIGLIRNLSSEEIVSQTLTLCRLHGKPQSILFMGMGEPLLNYNSVTRAIALLQSAGFGPRKITISTCGILKKIRALAQSGLNVRLAVSIGSAIEEKRSRLIPRSKADSLPGLRKALIFYRQHTKRRVSLEYTLIAGVNDTQEDAEALARFAMQTKSHVNLIRYNPVKSRGLAIPDNTSVRRFTGLLKGHGIEVSERYKRGQDISAACGQLGAGYQ